MKRMIALTSWMVLIAPSLATAQLQTRCFTDDWITTAAAGQGRNAWAVKCGYTDATRAVYADMFSEYQVFSDGCNQYPNVTAGSTCKTFVPVDPNAACIGGLTKLGFCVVGCYTGGQRLVFDGQYLGIESAYQGGATTVAGLSPESTAGALRFTEQSIQSFVAGDTKEDIWVLQGVDGRRIEVTSEHPMVDASGRVVRARTLQAGDALLGADGSVVTLSDVSVVPFVGKVWNVRPWSTDKLENILDAEGFLSGSVRFQNEWASDDYRLGLRDDADVSGP